ncbi:hypothetical protein BD289DRAFT_459490 [Coniella lustricola]|uniref:G-protein coupled receptors family 2 profile 2 domain-containing protein n=1 Tax=Coniella lustricola TaxID=2025994 RepID=A0A2T3AEB5_9PEZI|nr:hypothetical protein BD289DRAFT_459490 [Coniella lustricola]
MLIANISERQKDDFGDIARACSVLSLCGCIFVILTFLCSESFRKPITRLVFFASFGNMISNVATLIARTYVNHPNSVGCQAQGFLVQMFMPADALWSLAMAFNVYLTFYRKYDAQMLKRMELSYFVVCYGLPFIVALALCFVSSPERGHMYGDALLWCWISADWVIFRVIIFYIPVWFTIIATFFIYIRTGRQIYFKYQALKSLHSTVNSQANFHELLPSKTTEVSVESEAISNCTPDPTSLGSRGFGVGAIGGDGTTASIAGTPGAVYSVSITSNARTRNCHGHRHHLDHDQNNSSNGNDGAKFHGRGRSVEYGRSSTSTVDGGGVAVGDMVPLTPVRARSSLTPPPPPSLPPFAPATSAAAAAAGGTPPPPAPPPTPRAELRRTTSNRARRGFRYTRGGPATRTMPSAVSEANNAAWSYARCALLFFTAMLITWIPSTANRLYNVIHTDEICIGLQYTAVFVLPLQGFWNALIYAFTTRRSCKRMLASFKAHLVEMTKSKKKGSADGAVPVTRTDAGEKGETLTMSSMTGARRVSDIETG